MYRTQILLLFALLPLSGVSAQSSVWQVSDGTHTVYLGGTCHMLRAGDFPLPAEFDTAYAAANSLFFEVDPAEMNDPKFAMRLMHEGSYTDGRTLQSVLSAEAYTALADQCSQSGMPIEMLQKFKPSIAVLMLTLHELAKVGVTQAGVDMYYAKQADTDKKSVAALETADFQLDLITRLGEGSESELVLHGLQDLDQLNTLFDVMITAWRKGDLETINRLFVEDMAQYQEIYDLMLKDRNARWLPQIEAMLQSQPVEFVLVGVAHIPGKDGLIALLEAKGYAVTQVE
jgi:uncharacterized protein YbaP (TraB family)